MMQDFRSPGEAQSTCTNIEHVFNPCVLLILASYKVKQMFFSDLNKNIQY